MVYLGANLLNHNTILQKNVNHYFLHGKTLYIFNRFSTLYKNWETPLNSCIHSSWRRRLLALVHRDWWQLKIEALKQRLSKMSFFCRYYNFIGRPHLAHTVTSSNTRSSHYSSTNYSTADTGLSERASAVNGRQPPEEMALRRVT